MRKFGISIDWEFVYDTLEDNDIAIDGSIKEFRKIIEEAICVDEL